MRERTVYFSPKRLAREAQKRERQITAAKPIASGQRVLTQEEEADSIRRRWMRREGAMPCPAEPHAVPAPTTS
jgi:hypothetical protein